jgi:streptogramin lyase
LYSLAVSPDGAIYFLNANEHDIYRLEGNREVKVYTHTTYVRNVKFDGQGRLYFSESTGARADGVIYRLEDGRAVHHFQVRLSDVDGYWAGDFAFDAHGILWLSSGNRVPASLYQVKEGRPQRMFTAPGAISGFTFTDEGDLLFADWAQRVDRVELPGFHVSEAVYAPDLAWASDVAVVRGARPPRNPIRRAFPGPPVDPRIVRPPR